MRDMREHIAIKIIAIKHNAKQNQQSNYNQDNRLLLLDLGESKTTLIRFRISCLDEECSGDESELIGVTVGCALTAERRDASNVELPISHFSSLITEACSSMRSPSKE